jgi:homoserine trans-succinylase
MSRNDIVDLIDTTIENKSIQKLIFYYNNQRTDVKNLDSVFRLMDFEMLGYLALNNFTSNAIHNSDNNSALEKFKFIFNNFNNYWIYDTQDFDVSSEDIFTEDEEEFI